MPEKRVTFNGHSYQYNGKHGDSEYYRCSHYSATRCSARLIVCGSQKLLRGEHVCTARYPPLHADSISQSDTSVFNIEAIEVQKLVERFAADVTLYPSQIYQRVVSELSRANASTLRRLPSKEEVFDAIRRARGNNVSAGISLIVQQPLSRTRDGQRMLRRHWEGDLCGEDHRVLIWATEEKLMLLRYNGHVLVDGTFRVVPAEFSQCVVVMSYDPGTRLFIPCAFSLLSGKNEYIYCVLFHELIVMLQYDWMPTGISVDFELSLIKAIRHEFPDSRLIGCFFHMKQAISRKMKKLELPDCDIQLCLNKIELLTLIDPIELETGISFIRSTASLYGAKWDRFWLYFRKTWIGKLGPDLWNMHAVVDYQIPGRTNNALERYNRRLNDQFACPHPKLLAFVKVIEEEFNYYKILHDNIRLGIEPLPPPRQFSKPLIDSAYLAHREV